MIERLGRGAQPVGIGHEIVDDDDRLLLAADPLDDRAAVTDHAARGARQWRAMKSSCVGKVAAASRISARSRASCAARIDLRPRVGEPVVAARDDALAEIHRQPARVGEQLVARATPAARRRRNA